LWLPLVVVLVCLMLLVLRTICNVITPVTHRVRPRWAFLWSVLSTHDIVRTCCSGSEDEATSGWLILPIDAILTAPLMVVKCATKVCRISGPQKRPLKNWCRSAMQTTWMRQKGTCLRVIRICVGIEKFEVLEAVFGKVSPLFVCCEVFFGFEECINNGYTSGAKD
jgi:hypothetical protein